MDVTAPGAISEYLHTPRVFRRTVDVAVPMPPDDTSAAWYEGLVLEYLRTPDAIRRDVPEIASLLSGYAACVAHLTGRRAPQPGWGHRPAASTSQAA